MSSSESIAICITAAMIVMDYATGLLKACMAHDISSAKMREGLYHKAAYVAVVILAAILEQATLVVDIGITMPLVTPACAYIVLTELSSILENLGEVNPDLKDSRLLSLFRSNKEDDAR